MSQHRKSKKTKPFSEPWMLSDAVLFVANQKFYVHRNILASCSEVFKDIFATSNAEEISLPGKKAVEVQEMLYVIYPHVRKEISEKNCVFFLELAHEYQIKTLMERCEEYLKGRKNSPEEALHLIVLAQLFNLSADFIHSCLQEAKRIPVCSLEASTFYEKLNPPLATELHKESVHYWEKKILYLEAKKAVKDDRKQRLAQLSFKLNPAEKVAYFCQSRLLVF